MKKISLTRVADSNTAVMGYASLNTRDTALN